MKVMRIRLARKIMKNRHRYSPGNVITAAKRLGYKYRSWSTSIFIVK